MRASKMGGKRRLPPGPVGSKPRGTWYPHSVNRGQAPVRLGFLGTRRPQGAAIGGRKLNQGGIQTPISRCPPITIPPPSDTSDEEWGDDHLGAPLAARRTPQEFCEHPKSRTLFVNQNLWDFRESQGNNSERRSEFTGEILPGGNFISNRLSCETGETGEIPEGLELPQCNQAQEIVNRGANPIRQSPNRKKLTKRQAFQEKMAKERKNRDTLIKLIIQGADPDEIAKHDTFHSLGERETRNSNGNRQHANRKKACMSGRKEKRENKINLIVPDDKPHRYIPLPMKKIKLFVGMIDENRNQAMQDYFAKLFIWGLKEGKGYSHTHYKLMMNATMAGKCFKYFLKWQNQPLQEIVNRFLSFFAKRETFQERVDKLLYFKRFEREDIECTMYRYLLLAFEADKDFSRDEKWYTTEIKSLQVLNRAIYGPVLSAYNSWKASRLQKGLNTNFGDSIAEVKRLERKLEGVPKREILLPVEIFRNKNKREQAKVPCVRTKIGTQKRVNRIGMICTGGPSEQIFCTRNKHNLNITRNQTQNTEELKQKKNNKPMVQPFKGSNNKKKNNGEIMDNKKRGVQPKVNRPLYPQAHFAGHTEIVRTRKIQPKSLKTFCTQCRMSVEPTVKRGSVQKTTFYPRCAFCTDTQCGQCKQRGWKVEYPIRARASKNINSVSYKQSQNRQ